LTYFHVTFSVIEPGFEFSESSLLKRDFQVYFISVSLAISFSLSLYFFFLLSFLNFFLLLISSESEEDQFLFPLSSELSLSLLLLLSLFLDFSWLLYHSNSFSISLFIFWVINYSQNLVFIIRSHIFFEANVSISYSSSLSEPTSCIRLSKNLSKSFLLTIDHYASFHKRQNIKGSYCSSGFFLISGSLSDSDSSSDEIGSFLFAFSLGLSDEFEDFYFCFSLRLG